VLTEHESLEVLSEFGLIPIPSTLASDSDSAIAAAELFGFPVVLKTAAIGVLHKSDAGGVALGLSSSDEVGTSYGDLERLFGPDVLVQPRVDTSTGVELFLGMCVKSAQSNKTGTIKAHVAALNSAALTRAPLCRPHREG
jgi:acyl-CoA synthetase (NDP forming)